jgi:hypothetical protein
MSEISVIVSVPWGTALAKALQSGSAKVTVWNRTATKMLPLVGVGTHGASSPAAAAQASPIILICVENYPVTKRIMGESDVIPHLSGKTIIQLSTRTPREAREAIQELWGYLYRWCHHGFPVGIGTPYPNDAPENAAVWQMPRRQSDRRARVSLKLKMVLGNHLREISLCSRSLVF